MILKKSISICLIFIGVLTSFSERTPEILIIGDSISIGYTPFVRNKLSQEAIVTHNLGNAQHTGTGLKKIKEWIGDKDWDIIQFNWGLWDLCYRHQDAKAYGNRDKIKGEVTHSLEEYRENLDALIETMKQLTDAKLIFVTTSYIPEKEAGRFPEDAIKYNEVAIEVMNKHDILVNDIFKQTKSIHKRFGKGIDDVHYFKEGYNKLGKIISKFLLKEIKKRNKN